MSTFPALRSDLMHRRLAPPEEPVRLLIDTDAANEIDDQFAIAWALLTPERMTVEAVTAEPFSFRHHLPQLEADERAMLEGGAHSRQLVGGFQGWVGRLHARGRRVSDLDLVDTAQGMELSYREILRIYGKLGIDPSGRVYRGADRYMTDPARPVMSEAVAAIIDLARSGDSPLYIAAMGCVTNVAAAILKAPEIIRDIVVVWTAGYPSSAPHCNRPALNLVQDVASSRLMFDSGVPLIYLPGYHVGAQLRISLPEMERFVKGRGAIGDYLFHLYTNNPLHEMFALTDTGRRTWVIWDIIDIAWLIDPDWVPTRVTPSPILSEELYWEHAEGRHPIREAHDVQRDEIYRHFYDKLAGLG